MNIKKDSKHARFFNNEGNQSQSLFGFRTPPVLGAAAPPIRFPAHCTASKFFSSFLSSVYFTPLLGFYCDWSVINLVLV